MCRRVAEVKAPVRCPLEAGYKEAGVAIFSDDLTSILVATACQTPELGAPVTKIKHWRPLVCGAWYNKKMS